MCEQFLYWHSTWIHTKTQSLDLTKAIHSQSGTSFMSIALKERISIDNEGRQKHKDANSPFSAIIIKDVPDWKWKVLSSLRTVYSCICSSARSIYKNFPHIAAENDKNLRMLFFYYYKESIITEKWKTMMPPNVCQ